MGKNSRREYFKMIYRRYRTAELHEKSRILDEFCKICGYNRKYAIAKLNGPAPEKGSVAAKQKKHRKLRYSHTLISILACVWAATGFLCSVRLKAALPLWLPWIRKRFEIDKLTEKNLLTMSARQMDRRLQAQKRKTRRSIYGKTKPGTLLKHHIPIKTDHWDVEHPGFTEVDLVSHSGNSAAGNFAYSLNQTDILTTWVETRAVLGKSEASVVEALNEMRQNLPFHLEGIDSDNGSEFINDHLFRYCQKNGIQFTRGRPYKKDDNAHIEQKNWTHVRKLFAWYRYDTKELVDRMNFLYCHELRWLMNLFIPSMKLQHKIRVGSRIKRVYDQPKTALDRLIDSNKGNFEKITELVRLRESLNPFELSQTIERNLTQIQELATKVQPSDNKKCTDRQNEKRHHRNDPFIKKPWHSLGSIVRKDPEQLQNIANEKKFRKNT